MWTSRRTGWAIGALAAAALIAQGAPLALGARPVVAFTSPASGATVSGTTTVAATASDADGIAAVEFRVDGALIVRDTSAPYAVGWNTATVANGTRKLAAAAFDTRGNRTTVTRSVKVSNTPDTTGPTVAFSAPAAGASLAGTVAITATATDPSGVVSVRFAVDGQTLSTDTSSPYAHPAWDTRAVADGAHTLSLVATDARGNTRTVTRSVSVANPVPDTTGPSVAFLAPEAGATVSGDLDIVAAASDPSGVAEVRFTVDGETLSVDPDSPYSHGAWDTTTVADGPRGLALTATDALGNTTTLVRTVIVENTPPDVNPPVVAIDSPAAGTTVSGTVAIAAQAVDAGGVALVRFLVDGEEISADAEAPYVHAAWDTTGLADGVHLVEAVATDTSGNASVASATVTVERPPPDLSGPELHVTQPAEGANVAGVVSVTATAIDPSGVARVEFAAAGAHLGADDSAPYAHEWDTGGLEPGPHVLEVTAVDALGNRSVVSRAVVVEPAPAPPPAAGPLPGTPLMYGDFETGDLTQFRTVQRARAERVQVVASPVAEGLWAGRFEVRKGDTAASGTRSEVIAGPNVGEGAERWYEWRTMFAHDYPSIIGGFQITTQWHATVGGSQPMIVLFASGDEIGFKTVESAADLTPSPSVVHWRGPMDRGRWHTFRMRVVWSADRAIGLVELYHDGLRVVAPTSVATLIPGHDAYLKMGIYRSASHEPPAVVHHDGLVITAVD